MPANPSKKPFRAALGILSPDENIPMITIWHNSLLGTDKATAGWSRMFEIFMKEMVYWDAYYDGSSELRQDVLFTRVLP